MKNLIVFFLSIQLFAYCYYSENIQDQFVYETFFQDKKTPGIFVDVGAHNGVSNSNTFFFEKKMHWTGICIEASPVMFKQLKRNRKCTCINVACYNKEGYEKFLLHPVSYVSGLKEFLTKESKEYYFKDNSSKEITVQCKILNNILEQHSLFDIDYLSIDTEGADKIILESIDLDRFHIKVISVEGEPSLFERYMTENGYKSFGRIGNDAIFAKLSLFQ